MKINSFCIITITLSLLTLTQPAYACDPCSLYNVSRLLGHEENKFTLSLSEQYTRFKDIDESAIPRDGQVGKDFSSTQLSAGYDIFKNTGIQLTLPVIFRTYDVYERYRASSDSEFGIGDSIININYSPINYREGNWVILSTVLAGVKLPTGDTGSLSSIPRDTADQKHHTISSATGGRALSLGSGSIDFLAGLSTFIRYQRALVLGTLQYTYRNEGSFDYEFGDDILWSVGPGYFVLLEDEYSIALRGVFSGEHKVEDKQNDIKVTRSAISNLYIGPEAILIHQSGFLFDLGLDYLISDHRDSLIIPDFRIRTGISYRF